MLVVQDIADFLIYFSNPFFINFDQLAVVCHQSVYLYFHVGSLRIYSSRETLQDELFQLFGIFHIFMVTSLELLNCT